MPPLNLMADLGTTPTLFYATPGTRAVLVKTVGGKRGKQQFSFPDAHAALDWCLANGATLVCWPEARPERN